MTSSLALSGWLYSWWLCCLADGSTTENRYSNAAGCNSGLFLSTDGNIATDFFLESLQV